MKPKPLPPLRYEPPCAACAGPHRLDACATEDAATLLERDGKIMSAAQVRARAKGGAA